MFRTPGSRSGRYAGSLGVSVVGSNTEIIFSDSGHANGSTGFTFNKLTNNAVIANSMTVAILSIGNSTANLFANSILFKVANSTGTANLQPTQLVIGGSTVNATAYVAGANVFLDTVKLSVGNSTVNLIANSLLVQLANSTTTSNLTSSQVSLGANVFLSTT